MTESRAIENIRERIATASKVVGNGVDGKSFEDLEVAIKSLEKQIPTKPNFWGDGEYNGQIVIDMWDCPNCGKSYELECEEYDYCPNCGQAILWEESEE